MMFGRCVSKQERKQIYRDETLVDDNQRLVPAFSCPRAFYDKINSMSRDALRNLFRSIGVRNPYGVVLFEAEQPAVGPIPQRIGGVNEFKFPSGTEVSYRETLRV